jgi:2Fe-2S ferredoxin
VLTCATCHVHIAQEWTDRIEPAGFDETALLEMVDEVIPASRLSCQIVMAKALDGIIVKIPAAEH